LPISDLAGGQDGRGGTIAPIPNNDQGWGPINLSTLLDGTNRLFFDQKTALTRGGKRSARFNTIADPSKPLKVSLVWTDPPGPTVGNSLVNNLDLEVTANGIAYKGNVFSAGTSATGGLADTVNNVENVFLAPGAVGPAKVRVVGISIGGDGVPGNGDTTDQDFALVIFNANTLLPGAV